MPQTHSVAPVRARTLLCPPGWECTVEADGASCGQPVALCLGARVGRERVDSTHVCRWKQSVGCATDSVLFGHTRHGSRILLAYNSYITCI